MNMSVILFQIGFDRFSALAVDLDHPKHIWRVRYDSRDDLIRGLEQARAVTPEETNELRDGTCFTKGAPILRVTLNRKDIEHAGFIQVLPANMSAQEAH